MMGSRSRRLESRVLKKACNCFKVVVCSPV
jgi:hypothetical protein